MRCLPRDGGLLDQDWKYVNQLAIIIELDQKRQEKEAAEMEAKAKRQSR
jgi:hypothetical protein